MDSDGAGPRLGHTRNRARLANDTDVFGPWMLVQRKNRRNLNIGPQKNLEGQRQKNPHNKYQALVESLNTCDSDKGKRKLSDEPVMGLMTQTTVKQINKNISSQNQTTSSHKTNGDMLSSQVTRKDHKDQHRDKS